MPLFPLLTFHFLSNRRFFFFLRRLLWACPGLPRSISRRFLEYISTLRTRASDISVSPSVGSSCLLKPLAILYVLYMSYSSSFYAVFSYRSSSPSNSCPCSVFISNDFYEQGLPDFPAMLFSSINFFVLHGMRRLYRCSKAVSTDRMTSSPCFITNLVPLFVDTSTSGQIFLLRRGSRHLRPPFHILLLLLSSIHLLILVDLSTVGF